MFRCLLWVIAAVMRPKMLLIADNLCLRQQPLVLKRRQPRPCIKDAHRRFWILACRWFVGWQSSAALRHVMMLRINDQRPNPLADNFRVVTRDSPLAILGLV